MTIKNDEGIDISVEEFDEIWPKHLKISKIWTLMLLLTKEYNVLAKT